MQCVSVLHYPYTSGTGLFQIILNPSIWHIKWKKLTAKRRVAYTRALIRINLFADIKCSQNDAFSSPPRSGNDHVLVCRLSSFKIQAICRAIIAFLTIR
jgi:hypothetical protein